jgi:hypothetical protein
VSRRMMTVLVATILGCQPTPEVTAPRSTDSLFSYGFSANQRQRIGSTPEGRPASMALSAVVVTGTDLPPITPADVSAMVIRTADASIEVDSLEPAVGLVRALATRMGGYLANTEVAIGKNQLRSARLELKVPAGRFDESLSGLSPIGKVESVSVEAEDVGEQFVDVSARMENARRLERRLVELLASRTGKLKDVLDVEQALARVREEIERYEGRIRYLQAHTAMSTVSIYVHEPSPIVGSAGHSVLGEAFRQAWRNFVALVSVGVQALGILIPLGVVVAIVWIGTRRYRRVINQPTA